MKKVGIYARVSTIDQHPENQINVLRDYVKHHKDENGNPDYELFDEYIDKTSGRNQNRTDLNRMMLDIRKRLIDIVIIWKIDRLGRSVQHLLKIVEEWKKNGIELVITTLGIDTSTSSGKFVFGLLAQVAEFESELTSERTKLAIERKRAEGKHWGRPKGSKDGAHVKRRKGAYYEGWNKRRPK